MLFVSEQYRGDITIDQQLVGVLAGGPALGAAGDSDGAARLGLQLQRQERVALVLDRLDGGFETGILHCSYNVLDCAAFTEDDNSTVCQKVYVDRVYHGQAFQCLSNAADA